jgi:hypothetical protein
VSRKSKNAPTKRNSIITSELIKIENTTQHLYKVNFDAHANNDTIIPNEVNNIDIAIIIISKLFY